MSSERRRLLKALGTDLVLTGSPREEVVAIAPERLLMLSNPANPANPAIHEQTTVPEIWQGTDGDVDVFITGVCSCNQIIGVSRYLKIVRVIMCLPSRLEPTNSLIIIQALAGGEIKPGPHKIQGIGAGFIPDNLDLKLIDRVEKVTNDETISTVRCLMEEEGILAGISSGERYLSTALFADLSTSPKL